MILGLEGSLDTFDEVVPSPVRLLWSVFLEYENKWKLISFGKSCSIPLRYCHSVGLTELRSVFDADPQDFSNFHACGRECVKV